MSLCRGRPIHEVCLVHQSGLTIFPYVISPHRWHVIPGIALEVCVKSPQLRASLNQWEKMETMQNRKINTASEKQRTKIRVIVGYICGHELGQRCRGLADIGLRDCITFQSVQVLFVWWCCAMWSRKQFSSTTLAAPAVALVQVPYRLRLRVKFCSIMNVLP